MDDLLRKIVKTKTPPKVVVSDYAGFKGVST
jgi:hypothetical protein